MISCGHCKGKHPTVAGVRECAAIDHLLPEQIERVTGKPSPIEITEGMYYVGNDIVKVQKAVHGSGHLYAKKLVHVEPTQDIEIVGSWEFQMWRGGISQMRTGRNVSRMTLEQAQEFGRLYGICCRCGAVLTDETSISEGIGPVCAGKM